MGDSADPSTLAQPARNTSPSSVALYGEALRKSPLRAGFGMLIEYPMFASAVFLAASLFLTRVPLRIVDNVLGLRLRERFVNLLARISPG